MFHLYARIDLHEIESAVFVHQELHRARILIIGRFQDGHGRIPHLPAKGRCNKGRRGFFNQFLEAPLYGTLPFPQVGNVTLGVAEHLELNVTRFGNELFHIEGRISKGGAGLHAGDGKFLHQCFFIFANPYATATAPAGRLDHHRIPHFPAYDLRLPDGGDCSRATGDHRDPCGFGNLFGGQLIPGKPQVSGRGTDKGQPLGFAQGGECLTFRQVSVARMDGIRPCFCCGGQDVFHVQIAL